MFVEHHFQRTVNPKTKTVSLFPRPHLFTYVVSKLYSINIKFFLLHY